MGLVILTVGRSLSYLRDHYTSVVFDASTTSSAIPGKYCANGRFAGRWVQALRNSSVFVTHATVLDLLHPQKGEIPRGYDICEGAGNRVVRIHEGDEARVWRKLKNGLRGKGIERGVFDPQRIITIEQPCQGEPYADFPVGCLALLRSLSHGDVALLTSNEDLAGFVEDGLELLRAGKVQGVSAKPGNLDTYLFARDRGVFFKHASQRVGVGA